MICPACGRKAYFHDVGIQGKQDKYFSRRIYCCDYCDLYFRMPLIAGEVSFLNENDNNEERDLVDSMNNCPTESAWNEPWMVEMRGFLGVHLD
jgi:hypothetical protein